MTARVVKAQRGLAVDPLKHSQALGGTMAVLGLHRSMPLLSGSQGCSAFAKALLTRHFREPIPLQTTALVQQTVILGGEDALVEALETITADLRPDVIGVLTTGLTEMSGDDIAAVVRRYLAAESSEIAPMVFVASTPDFKDGLEKGWGSVVEAIVTEVAKPESTVHGQVNLLVGPALGALDVEELRNLVDAFGLKPIVLPDLSGSMDGHLEEDWSGLTTGGTRVGDLHKMGSSEATLVIGSAVSTAGDLLESRCGIPSFRYGRLSGLGAVDSLVAELSDLSGRAVPDGLRRWRSRLADGMLDTHFVLGGVRVGIALEPDLLLSLSSLLAELGAEIVAAVAPTPSPALSQIPCDEVVVGDFADFEERVSEGGAQLILASSHARPIAERLGAAHLCMGFPVFDRLGHQYQLTAGYRGSLEFLFATANCIVEQGYSRSSRVSHVG